MIGCTLVPNAYICWCLFAELQQTDVQCVDLLMSGGVQSQLLLQKCLQVMHLLMSFDKPQSEYRLLTIELLCCRRTHQRLVCCLHICRYTIYGIHILYINCVKEIVYTYSFFNVNPALQVLSPPSVCPANLPPSQEHTVMHFLTEVCSTPWLIEPGANVLHLRPPQPRHSGYPFCLQTL